MSIESPAITRSRTARMAVSLFFFICVPLSVWETSVHSTIFVAQDPVATADRLLAHEFAFRTTMLSHIIGTTVFVVFVWLLYVLLRPVNPTLALLMIAPILLQFALVFVMECINYTALMTLKSESRASFDVAQQQEAAYFLLRLCRYAIGANKIVLGLSFILLGLLFYQSGLVPRAIGILILLGGIGYVIDTSLYFLLQRADYLTIKSIKLLSSATYSLGLLWLLIRGLRPRNAILEGD